MVKKWVNPLWSDELFIQNVISNICSTNGNRDKRTFLHWTGLLNTQLELGQLSEQPIKVLVTHKSLKMSLSEFLMLKFSI